MLPTRLTRGGVGSGRNGFETSPPRNCAVPCRISYIDIECRSVGTSAHASAFGGSRTTACGHAGADPGPRRL